MININNNPLLTLILDEEIIDSLNLCQFIASPNKLSIQLDNFIKLSAEETEVLNSVLDV